MLMICHGSRAVGIFSRTSDVNVALVLVFFVSTTGDTAEIVTSSVIWPISSFWSIWALNPVEMTTFWRTDFLKLASSNVTLNVPIGTLGNWYVPFSLVTPTSGDCNAGPVTVTVAPGSTPPDGSVTFPKMEPIAWAWAGNA